MIKLTVCLTESRFFIDTMMCTDDTRIKDCLVGKELERSGCLWFHCCFAMNAIVLREAKG